jgi:hypothetical protein
LRNPLYNDIAVVLIHKNTPIFFSHAELDSLRHADLGA